MVNKMNKNFLKIIIYSFIVLIILILLIMMGNKKPQSTLYKDDLKIEKNIAENTFLVKIYFKNEPLININGWDTIIKYGSTAKKLFSINQKKEFDGKFYYIHETGDKIELLSSDLSLEKSFFGSIIDKTCFNLYCIKYSFLGVNNLYKSIETLTMKDKNHLNINTDFYVENGSLSVGYGLLIKGFDIFLPNGTSLKNDHLSEKTKSLKKLFLDGEIKPVDTYLSSGSITNVVLNKGTNYKIFLEEDYQIFYNSDKKIAIIVFADDIDYVENLFQWEVFRFWINGEDYEDKAKTSLNIVFLSDAALGYTNKTWMIKSNEFDGDVKGLLS